jgi:peptidoglycan/xylan/chitin deacetylase (PgdA/CDA1 family)
VVSFGRNNRMNVKIIIGLVFVFSLMGCTEKDNNFIESTDVEVFQQFVILKADDIVFNSSSTISLRWIKFFDYIESKNIKASLGLIGNSLEKGDDNYYALLKELNASGNFELWNHGYTHTINGIDENGILYNEFKNSLLEYQKEHLIKTQNLAKEKLNIVLRTFGAPGNGVDYNTVLALKEINDIDVWFFGTEKFPKTNLKRSIEIEFPAGTPDFLKFQSNYNAGNTLVVLQIHPNSWNEAMFGEFKKAIDFLMEKNVMFINPYEYSKRYNKQYGGFTNSD